MNNKNSPVKVQVSLESLETSREAFYKLCFIAESDEAPRTLEVSSLADLLKGGYKATDLAFNFCVGVFSQGGIESVFIRAKRSNESYQEAYDSEDNGGFYYIIIQSKDIAEIKSFNKHLLGKDDLKVQFFSSTTTDVLEGDRLVQYYQEGIPLKDVYNVDRTYLRHFYINKAYNLGYNSFQLVDYAYSKEFSNRKLRPFSGFISITNSMLVNGTRLAYPEGAWVALCGDIFPSRVQWLYKDLAKADVVDKDKIPKGLTSSSETMGVRSTFGSGKTSNGLPINEQVSFDWVKWALGKKLWETLYTQGKINSTAGGVEVLKNDVRFVLDVAVTEEIFSEYNVKEVKVNPRDNSISIKFTAMFVQSILSLEVEGTLHY